MISINKISSITFVFCITRKCISGIMKIHCKRNSNLSCKAKKLQINDTFHFIGYQVLGTFYTCQKISNNTSNHNKTIVNHYVVDFSVSLFSLKLTISLLTSIERILSEGSMNPRCIHLGMVTRAWEKPSLDRM